MLGPASGRSGRVTVLRALLACLALTSRWSLSIARRASPRPSRPTCSARSATASSSPQDSPLRRTGRVRRSHRRCRQRSAAARQGRPAKSRIGAIPTYGLPAASGASASGYDSLNRTRKKPKFYPGQAKPKPPPGPGCKPPPPLPANGRVRLSVPPSETANKTPMAPAMAGTVAGQPPRKRLEDR